MNNTTSIKQPNCDDYDPNSLTVEQAHERIEALISPIEHTETLGIMDAFNRTLAEDIQSPINVPPYSNSSMDGYAVNNRDLPEDGKQQLKLVGKSWAGTPFEGEVNSGECVRIMTGAKMPNGTDTVIMQEHTQREGDTLTITAGNKAGQNVRHPGEDMAMGEVVLTQGKLLKAAEMGLLASLGIANVRVKHRLRVAFFSTGDELRAVGETLQDGQIYDSNRYTLFGMLRALDVDITDLGVIRDKREDVETAFAQAASLADVVITSGGVSVGDADFVKETLDKLGQVDFWKIAMKPGKPLAFGIVDKALFFGLPGNPVSVMVTFYQFVLPAIRRLMGQTLSKSITLKVPCATALKKQPGRMDFQRGVLDYDAQGQLVVKSAGQQASHILSGMSKADCFIILPRDWGNVEAGTLVEIQPFAGLM